MSSSSSTSGIGSSGHYPPQPTLERSQSASSTARFISIEGPIDDKVVIKNRLEWLAAQIEKAAALLTSSPEKKNLADEGLIKYDLKRKIAAAELDVLEKALTYVQKATPAPARLSSSSSARLKENENIAPSALIENYEKAVHAVKKARNNRNEAITMHGDKEKKILDEIEKAEKIIHFQLTQALKAEQLVLDAFNTNARQEESYLKFLKTAIDHHIEFGLIKYGKQDILFNRATVQALEHKDVDKRTAKLKEINDKREDALKVLQSEILDDCEQLLVHYLSGLRDHYQTQTEAAIEGKISDTETLLDSLKEQTSSKENSKQLHAEYLANSKNLHTALVILTKPLEKGKLYSAKFKLSTLKRRDDQLKQLIEDIKVDGDNKKLPDETRENCRNMASKLINEHIQAKTCLKAIKFEKEQRVRDNNDDNDSPEKNEDYAKFRSGFVEILITEAEKKILEKYQSL